MASQCAWIAPSFTFLKKCTFGDSWCSSCQMHHSIYQFKGNVGLFLNYSSYDFFFCPNLLVLFQLIRTFMITFLLFQDSIALFNVQTTIFLLTWNISATLCLAYFWRICFLLACVSSAWRIAFLSWFVNECFFVLGWTGLWSSGEVGISGGRGVS